MNIKLRLIGEQVLIVFNVFILFLLLFAHKLILPFWLQPVGRMHTLLLHFPIVILLLALGLDLFRFTIRNSSNIFYADFTRWLLLAGILLAGVTVIMGLFLSREEGYTGDTLTWHKWTGAGIFFLGSLLYWLRGKSWYRTAAAGSGAGIMLVSLLITGHYGATLTHGENYILQPIDAALPKPAVPLEQAELFKDLIQPILEKKCTGCHNPRKLKGEMSLRDTLSILKGGKSGKLFIPGNPDSSLITGRLLLPPDDEKHMPPAGKPQLTAGEITLLSAWIREGAGFSQKVLSLPAGDSLRILATAILKPATDSATLYLFPPADEIVIARLNTDYRTIAHLAKESPALDVSLYNRDAYTVKQLQELDPVKSQIVSLNLTKLPVRDPDLVTISRFENLRRLDLNFTDITAGGLSPLRAIKYLQTLSLSGTKISFDGLKATLAGFKNLKTVTVWDTGLTTPEIAQLQQLYRNIHFIEGFKNDGRDTLKLNPPLVKNNTLIFSGQLPVDLRHPVRGVEIRYTTDGSEPDSLRGQVLNGPLLLSKNTSLKVRAFKKGWYSSDVAVFDFFKNTFIPDSVQLLQPLNSVHQAEGAHTFFNTKLGVIGANNPAWANYWAGVKKNDLEFVALFNKPVTISSAGLHFMVEEATGIYPPGSVEVWGGDAENNLKLLAIMKPPLPVKGEKPALKLTEAVFKAHTLSYLKIIARPLLLKKERQLLLVDEMFLN